MNICTLVADCKAAGKTDIFHDISTSFMSSWIYVLFQCSIYAIGVKGSQ